MKKYLSVLFVALTITLPHQTIANPVERACNRSDRGAATRALCSCIGHVADNTLSRAQMREGARFFNDPQRAQDVRQSDRRSDERLWQAWRDFGDTAQATCS